MATLLLALSCPALAGEIHTTGAPTPPPPPQTSAMQEPTDDTTLNGEMSTPDASGILTQTALDLLALLPSLL